MNADCNLIHVDLYQEILFIGDDSVMMCFFRKALILRYGMALNRETLLKDADLLC